MASIGEMIEEMEGRVRTSLYEVYFGKTREVPPRLLPLNPNRALRFNAGFYSGVQVCTGLGTLPPEPRAAT